MRADYSVLRLRDRRRYRRRRRKIAIAMTTMPPGSNAKRTREAGPLNDTMHDPAPTTSTRNQSRRLSPRSVMKGMCHGTMPKLRQIETADTIFIEKTAQKTGERTKIEGGFSSPLQSNISLLPRERCCIGLILNDLGVVADCGGVDRDIARHIRHFGIDGRSDVRRIRLVILRRHIGGVGVFAE